jgi:hypothetical protein
MEGKKVQIVFRKEDRYSITYFVLDMWGAFSVKYE